MDDPTPWRLFWGWSIGLLLTAGGALAVILTIRNGIFLGRLHRHGIRTPGIVVGHDDSPQSVDRPVFQFADQYGRLQTFIANQPSNKFVPLGQRREVVYLPDRPEKARLYRTGTSPLQRVWPVLLSALFLGLGLAMTTTLAGVRFPRPSEGVALTVFWTLSSLNLGVFWALVVSSIGKVLSLRRNGLRTVGTVIRAEDKENIVVEFTDTGGRTIQFADLKNRRTGAQVPVLYSEHAPEDARVDSLSRNVGILLFLLVFSVLLVGGFLISLF